MGGLWYNIDMHVVIAVPRGREYQDGFVKSLLSLLLYEKNSNLYTISISFAEEPSKDLSKYEDVAEKRRKLLEDAIASGATHILYLDDDMMFAPNTLRRLMAHKKPFVSGLGFMRKNPFYPTIFQITTKRDGNLITEKYNYILNYPDEPFIVDGVGMFCCLIDLSIISKLRKPWFETGGIRKDSKISEDISFSRRLWEGGIPITIDPNIKTGHIIDKKSVITELSFKKAMKDARKLA